MRKRKNSVRIIVIFIILISIILINGGLKIYIVKGSSMENTLFSGDIVLLWNYFGQYKPMLNDIVVFRNTFKKRQNEILIKRIISDYNFVIKFKDGEYYLNGLKYHNNNTKRFMEIDFKRKSFNLKINTFLHKNFEITHNDYIPNGDYCTYCVNISNLQLKSLLKMYPKEIGKYRYISRYDCETQDEYSTTNKNDYFLIGDNYSASYDSRCFGFVDKKNIIGKVILVLQKKPLFSKHTLENTRLHRVL